MTNQSPTPSAPIAFPVVMLGRGHEGFFCTGIVAMTSGDPVFAGLAREALRPSSCLPVSARRAEPTARRAGIAAGPGYGRRSSPPRGTHH